MTIEANFLRQIIILIIIFFIISGCSNTNQTKTDKKILNYESAGSAMSALSIGAPGASVLFLAIDLNNYLKFNLNNKEVDMHTNAIQLALNNTPNGKVVSWHNSERLSSGKVRVVKTYYKNDKYCRIFQSYIKLNGAEKHRTKHVCKFNNIWKF